jgi:nucleotide-binding universal stress UspA family protein
VRSGPVLIAYDGSGAAEHALREAGALLGRRPALVVVVWQEGLGFELLDAPTATIGLPAATVDIRTALEVDRALYERSQQLAQHGAGLARDAGFDAEGLAVADAPHVSVAETIVSVAHERDAQALVVGARGHSRAGEVLLGSVSREVVRHARCPVVVVRRHDEG